MPLSNLVIVSILFIMVFLYSKYNFLKITDSPNLRSMHSRPKPNMGGLFLIISILFFFYFQNLDNFKIYFIILSLSILIGILDDLNKIKFKIKFLTLLLLCYILIYLNFENNIYSISILIFTFIFTFHFINIFNFMDGTDGTALSQTIFFLTILLLFNNNIFTFYQIITLIIFCLVLLFFNLPNSKLFIGNVGSYSISSLLILIFFNEDLSINNFIIWIITFLFFYLDTSFTLVKRLLNNKNIFEAHKDHLYQKIASKKNHLYFFVILNIYNYFIVLPYLYLSNILLSNDLFYHLIFIFINIIVYILVYRFFNVIK